MGREGPIVQIGSAWGSAVGQFLGVGPRQLRTLVACGAAAGIAATFNAPIAGAFFATEVILGEFSARNFTPVVISSVAATVVGHAFFGDLPAFVLPAYELRHPMELIAYVVLGILAAVVATSFIHLLHFSEDVFEKSRLVPSVRAAFGGLLVGCIALFFPDVFGLGYAAIESALAGGTTTFILLSLLGVKSLATCITLGSGGSGGIFAPSLFLGAMTGGLVGAAVQLAFPGHVAPPGSYALVGMAAVVAATTHAPMSAIFILFELTNDYQLILPLMTTCVLATLFAGRLNKDSIYTAKLRRRGINIAGGQVVDLLRDDQVREIVSQAATTVLPSADIPTLEQNIMTSATAMNSPSLIRANGKASCVFERSCLVIARRSPSSRLAQTSRANRARSRHRTREGCSEL
ncbi:MAG: chloride channel protein [Planctomycetota bacterium]